MGQEGGSKRAPWHHWTGSKTDRVMACPASAVLPQVSDTRPSPEAEWGQGVHRFLYDHVRLGRDGALACLPKNAPWAYCCEGIAIDEFFRDLHRRTRVYPELALAYNPTSDTARVLGEAIDRNYPASADEICLTADLIAIDTFEKTSGAIFDYKTSKGDGRKPQDMGQLLLGACAASAAYGLETVLVGVIRIDRDGSWMLQSHILTPKELEEAKERVQATWHKLVTARDEPSFAPKGLLAIGDHCRYCPSFRLCPAQTMLAASLASKTEPFAMLPWRALGDVTGTFREEAEWKKNVAKAWVKLKDARLLLDVAEDQLRGHIARLGRTTYEDTEVYLSRVVLESIDAKKAGPLLRELLGEEAAARVIDERIAKTTLEKVCRETGRDSAFVLERLRQMGACPVTESSQIRTRKIKEPQA